MAFLRTICPVCALVLLTWLSMLVFKGLGYDVNDELLAMLMGGSVVGISYVLGARLPSASHRPSVGRYWKLVAIPIGFSAMYALLSFAWGYAVLALVVYAAAWMLFRAGQAAPTSGKNLKDITKALDNCCD